MCHERPFTPGMGEMCVWWKEMRMTGVAGCHRGKPPGCSLGFIFIHVSPKTALGAHNICLLDDHTSPSCSAPTSPLSIVSVAWEAGIKAGSPTCTGSDGPPGKALHRWRFKICCQGRHGLLSLLILCQGCTDYWWNMHHWSSWIWKLLGDTPSCILGTRLTNAHKPTVVSSSSGHIYCAPEAAVGILVITGTGVQWGARGGLLGGLCVSLSCLVLPWPPMLTAKLCTWGWVCRAKKGCAHSPVGDLINTQIIFLMWQFRQKSYFFYRNIPHEKHCIGWWILHFSLLLNNSGNQRNSGGMWSPSPPEPPQHPAIQIRGQNRWEYAQW